MEARIFKVNASFAAETMGKKGCNEVWTGQKLLHCMKRGTQKDKYLKNSSSGVAMRSCDDAFLKIEQHFPVIAEIAGYVCFLNKRL